MSNPSQEAIPSTRDATLIVRATGVRKSYDLGRKRVDVLRGVSLEVRTGEFLAIRGASGAGKSTLLHLLGGLDAPDQGEVHVSGEALHRLGSSALARFRNTAVGFVFQAYHLLHDLDAVENVCLPARMARRPLGDVVTQARELLNRVGLGERHDHRPSELSGGEQQRLALARALINSPKLLLADEPTGNLDSHTGEEIIQLLRGLQQERGATLIIATHDARVAAHADRVVELVDGTLG